MDSIMILSGSENKFIRASAFSTLSSLAQYSSKFKSVMCQVKRDIEFPTQFSVSGSSKSDSLLEINEEEDQNNYQAFISSRLQKLRQ